MLGSAHNSGVYGRVSSWRLLRYARLPSLLVSKPILYIRCRHHFFLGFPLFVLIFSVPLRAQLVSEKSVLVAATMLLPMLGATAVGCVLTATFNATKNFVFESMFAGTSLSLIGCALLTTVSGIGDDKNLLGYLVLVGFGVGLSITSSTGLTMIEIPPRDYGMASQYLSYGHYS